MVPLLTGMKRLVSVFAVVFATALLAQSDPAGTAGAPASAAPAAPAAAVVVPPAEEMGLEVDATLKEHTAKPGEESCVFTFAVQNISKADLVINEVRTSCGCTVATLPSQPWRLKPGERGDIMLNVDLRGKSGTMSKTATIDLPTGFKQLTFRVTITADTRAMQADLRARNQQLAAANRQAVFQGDCAKCHVAPTVGQHGVGVYVTACSICHDAEQRATMVPDLHALQQPTDKAYWRTIVTEGKPGTLMPAFAQAYGGPLTPVQIESLVEYLAGEFSGRAPTSMRAGQGGVGN